MVNSRALWIAVAATAAAGVLAANAHLVYVAMRSQPDCVAHAAEPDASEETYRAAKSACEWRGDDQ